VGIAGLLLAGGITAVEEVKVKLGIEIGIDKEGRPVELLDWEEIGTELDPVALALVLVAMGRSELNNDGRRPSELLLLLLELADAEEVAVGITADE
jgi:hypothetical protein